MLNKLGRFNFLSLIGIFIISLLIGISGQSVSANSSQIPFQLQPIKPDNQFSSNSYDDLLIQPDTSQDLSFVVSNSDASDKTFIVEANNATTSNGIAIAYDDHDKTNLSNPMFTDFVTNNRKQKISIPGNSSQVVTFNLKYPTQKFEGVILGGITIYLDDNTQQSKSGSFTINNRFTYSSAIQLRMDKNSTVIPKLVAHKAQMTVSNAYPYVIIKLNNEPRAIISQMSIESSIQDMSGRTIETYKTANGQVAPNSDFNLSIPLTNGALPAGKYHVIGIATSGNNQWSFNQEFEVTESNSKNIDKESIVKPQINYLLYLSIILSLLIVILIIVIVFLVIKNRKKEDENNEKNS